MFSKVSIDGLTLWKVAAIAITGLLGALGVFTDFKRKGTQRLTRWGWLVIALIALSTLGGALAQIIESDEDARSALNAAAISLQTSKDTERLLMPLRGATYKITFRIDCENARFREMCKNDWATTFTTPKVNPLSMVIEGPPLSSQAIWRNWPGGPKKFRLDFSVDFFSDPTFASAYARGGTSEAQPDAGTIVVTATNYADKKSIGIIPSDESPFQLITASEGFDLTITISRLGINKGSWVYVSGLSELCDHTVVIGSLGDSHQFDGMTPVGVEVSTKTGYSLRAVGFRQVIHQVNRYVASLIKETEKGQPAPVPSAYYIGRFSSSPDYDE